MEIKTSEGHLTFTFNTDEIDFEKLVSIMDQVPTLFRIHVTNELGISESSYYLKKRTKSFTKLEKEALSCITGISIELI